MCVCYLSLYVCVKFLLPWFLFVLYSGCDRGAKWPVRRDPSQHSGSVSVCHEHLQDVPESGIKETQGSSTPASTHADYDITGLNITQKHINHTV